MKISWMTQFGLWLDRLTSKNTTNTIGGKVSSSGQGVGSVLFILPEEEDYFRVAEHFLKTITNPNISLAVLGQNHVKNSASLWLKNYLFTYSEADLNRWGLPGTELTDKLTNVFDAVVDMSPVLHPVSSILTRCSNAPLRIGMNHQYSDHYFNVVIKKNRTDSLEKTYKNIQQILGL